MGLFDAITGSVVMKYKVETDQAKAKIKELSGEQKKAAKEAAEALEKQGKAAESMASQYAKGAAIIVGGFMAAKDGLAQLQKETRLTAGAQGVDIDALSDSWDGLKTRMDLLAFAQAGHQGAWKLTTAQLQNVTDGMRALEAKGFETGEVFDKFTEVIKKGKLEGLDDFGLSLQSTGNQSQDLQILMNALGREVLDVGGNFEKAGDAATRATVQMQDGISRVRVMIGEATNAALDFAAAAGRWFGKQIYGDLPEDVGPGGKASAYAEKFRMARGGYRVRTEFDRSSKHYSADASLSTIFDQEGFAGTDLAGKQLAAFSDAVRQGMRGKGPLATATPEEFARYVSGLPEDWRKVDDFLAKRVDELGANLQDRFNTVGVEAAKGIFQGFKNAFDRNKQTPRGRGGGRAADPGPGLIFGAAHTAFNALSAVADYGNAQNDNAAARARQDEILQQRFAATMEQNRRFSAEMAQQQATMAQAKEQSFLERTFGKVEEFDQYAAAFDTLKGAVTSGFNAWITGAESVGTAVRRSIAQSLGGYAIEMAGMALVAAAHGVYHLTNPLTAAQGAGELFSAAKYAAAAVALGGLAKLASPAGNSAPSTAGSATGGRAGRNQDHRGSGGGDGHRPGAQSTVMILGSDYGDDSRRVRERNAYAAFSRTATVYQPPRGAAA